MLSLNTLLKKSRNFLLLHLIVFIWGFTAILGKLISIGSLHLVWFRILIAIGGIAGYMIFKKISFRISGKQFLRFMGVGIIIALHWLCFYQAIKVSNVSVTLACFSCGALFSALIEPLFFKRKIDWKELVLGGIVIAAILMIFRIEPQYKQGIILSVLAALGSATFSVLNGLLVKKSQATVISFYELSGGFIFLSACFAFTGDLDIELFKISTNDFLYLLLLGLICTAFTFVISVEVMKEISPYTVNLTVNLESVYGIILAFIIWQDDERMSAGFYIGTLVIFATVFGNAVMKKYIK